MHALLLGGRKLARSSTQQSPGIVECIRSLHDQAGLGIPKRDFGEGTQQKIDSFVARHGADRQEHERIGLNWNLSAESGTHTGVEGWVKSFRIDAVRNNDDLLGLEAAVVETLGRPARWRHNGDVRGRLAPPQLLKNLLICELCSLQGLVLRGTEHGGLPAARRREVKGEADPER